MRDLTPRESEFLRMTQGLFGFLQDRQPCRFEIANDIEGVLFTYTGRSTAVEIRFESDRALFLDVVPLQDGQLPPRFDHRGRELHTRSPLGSLIAELDPSWREPERLDDLADRDDLLEALRLFADGLKQHRDRILSADPKLFDAVEAGARRRLGLIMLEDWARFVDRVRRGFTGDISEYTLAITERGQLEDVLHVWKGNSEEGPRAQLAHLDRAFDDLTEPVPPPRSGGPFVLVPDPNAARWWRRPKALTGRLREYFSSRK